MSTLFSGRHVDGALCSTNMVAPYWAQYFCAKTIRRISEVWEPAVSQNLEKLLYNFLTKKFSIYFSRCVMVIQTLRLEQDWSLICKIILFDRWFLRTQALKAVSSLSQGAGSRKPCYEVGKHYRMEQNGLFPPIKA